LAREIGLPNAKKKDSTGICFIGERPFRAFLNQYISSQPGPIKNEMNQTLGQHMGLSFYTLGQRQGLGIGGVKDLQTTHDSPSKKKEHHEPWFVAYKDMKRNTLWAVQGHDHPALLSDALSAQDLSWTCGQEMPDLRHADLTAKTRYRQVDALCQVESMSALELKLSFAQAQWAVTPGQSVVLYRGDECLGGGVIWGYTPRQSFNA
jgi:tRNA-specific 2-thiouridylase